MNTINEEDKTNETPLEDLRQQALKHYEDVSTTSNHWSGFIVKAIKAYDPKRDAEVERLRNECGNLNQIIATKLNEIFTLKKENEELRADDLSSLEWLRTLNELAALQKQVEEMSEPTSEMIHMANLFLGDGFEQNWGDGYCWNESAIILRKTTEPSLTEYVVITRSHRIVKFFGHYSA